MIGETVVFEKFEKPAVLFFWLGKDLKKCPSLIFFSLREDSLTPSSLDFVVLKDLR